MKKIISLILIFTFCLPTFTSCNKGIELQKFTDYSFDYFDTVTTIIGYEENEETFHQNCEKVKTQLEEYHRLYDIYTFYNGLNNLAVVNSLENGKHNKISVNKKIIDLILFSKEMYRKTNGKVNIAAGSVLSIWHNARLAGLDNPEEATLPNKKALKEASLHTNIEDVIVDSEKNTVWLKDNEMTLDVGAVAKGYAVEQIGEYMKSIGLSSYLLNVGGNVKVINQPADDDSWTVGIENSDTENLDEPYTEILKISNNSLVTSGNYQRFYTVNGKNYNHIIDPLTLFPAEYYNSVSVLCQNSGIADALSTALFCMSVEEGNEVLKNFDNVEVLWVTTGGEKIYTDNFKNYLDE